MSVTRKSTILPKSVTPAGVVWASTASFLGSLFYLYTYDPFNDIIVSACFILGLMSLVTLSTDFFAYRSHLRGTTGMDYSRRDISLNRTLTKLVGLTALISIFALLYNTFPFYANDLYQFFMSLARKLLIPTVILAIPYVFFVDMYQIEPRDGLWSFGKIFCFRWSDVCIVSVQDFFRGWIIKGFFLPLMFGYFCYSLQELQSFDLSSEYQFTKIFGLLYVLAYLFDLSVSTIGYVSTIRPLDTHIRSTNPTALGWIVAIVCYAPFWPFIIVNFLNYNDDLEWGKWLWNNTILYSIWGTLILMCLFGYVSATAQFGCRFSNLTNRGIITSGPYRWTKHPAYISKNISWWLIAIPFISSDDSFTTAFRNCLLLACVNGIYYLRAKTEEKHLYQDPVYVKYAVWISKNGIVATCRNNMMRLVSTKAGR